MTNILYYRNPPDSAITFSDLKEVIEIIDSNKINEIVGIFGFCIKDIIDKFEEYNWKYNYEKTMFICDNTNTFDLIKNDRCIQIRKYNNNDMFCELIEIIK